MNNLIVEMKLFSKKMIEMIAGHMAWAVGTVVVVACLAVLYYLLQHGVLDDEAEGVDDKVVEIPLGD